MRFDQIAASHGLEQILAAKPTAKWDGAWGKGFVGPDDFLRTVHQSLTNPPRWPRGVPNVS